MASLSYTKQNFLFVLIRNDNSMAEPSIKAFADMGNSVSKLIFLPEDKYDAQRIQVEKLEEADCVVVYYSLASTGSANFLRSVTDILQYTKDNNRIFIPVMDEKVQLSHIKEIPFFDFIVTFHSPSQVTEEINKYLEKELMSASSRPQKKAAKKRSPSAAVPNEQVKEIQTTLRTLNMFNSQVDGLAGPITTKAIEGFQALYRLPVTGEWNEQTKKKAEEILKSRETKKETPPKETKQTPPAEEIKQQPPKTDLGPKFWLLKIYGDDWGLDKLKEGDIGYFNAHFNNYEPREEYDDFKSVKIGEKGFAYDYSSKKGIVFSYEVTEPLHEDAERGEIFNFKISRFFKTHLPLTSFVSLIERAGEFSGESIKKLIPITATEHENISNLINSLNTLAPVSVAEDEEEIIKTSLSAIFSDSAAKDLKDQLGFESDVNALASVISYKEVKPPLAIGLFGHWGSGKSFFMNKLEQRIEYLAKNGGDAFCKKVLSISFNSWHYSDSNLWASLITKIFEDLEKYGTDQKDKVSELFKNLNSTKELLEETKIEKEKVDKQISTLEEQKRVFDTDATKQANELRNLSIDEMIAGAMKNASVNTKIEDLKTQFPFLELKGDDIDSIKENISELKDTSGKVAKSLKITYSFRNGKIWLVVLCLLLVFGAVYYLASNTEALKKISVFIGIVAALFSKVMLFLRPAMKTVNTAYKKLEEINITVDELRSEAMSKFSKKQEELQQKIDGAKNEGNELQKKIDLLMVEQQKLQNEIDDITTGRKIIRFIESRVSDQRYINSLGIISWIRKDFEQLNTLLKQQVQARQVDPTNKELPGPEFELERIILYIDDLDRCDESIVVKVLEAIHLLLAFPLFVVVVGVDPRWMHNALNKKYADFLYDPEELKTKTNGQQKATSGTANNNGLQQPVINAATSFDYLEKIFQIPFVLKPMNSQGKSNLIRSQLESKPEENKTVIPPTNGKDTPTPTTEVKPAPIPKPIPVTTIDPHMASVDVEVFPELLEGNIGDEPIITPKPDLDPDPTRTPTSGPDPKKEEPEIIPLTTEKLKISEEEIEFMQNIAFLIGDSPRTIKRYINIYRIIRTHATFEFTDENLQEHYQAVMILLAFITGSPDEAKSIISELAKYDSPKSTFNDFIKFYRTNNAESKALKKLDDEIKYGNRIKSAGNIKVEKFEKNLDLTCRFSFRRLN